ncbi:MAG: PTS sugar transporter subunit IIB [Clostridium sp.]
MVELCRIDDRLLHGQVAVTWVGAVAPEAILIANDEAATNEMSKLALKMAKPAGVKLAVKTIADAATLLNNPNAKKIKIFLITRTIQDTLELVKMTDCIHRVNIGGVKNKEEVR